MTIPRVFARRLWRRRSQHGFVAIEFSAAIALLLLPVTMLVASLPSWSTREHSATVIAREAARLAAQQWPNQSDAAIDTLVVDTATNLGADPRQVTIEVTSDQFRGGQVRATVTIVMPAISVPGIGTAGAWHWSTTATVRIDDYRSRS